MLIIIRWHIVNMQQLLFSLLFIFTGLSSQGYGFSSSHVWMWELDGEESWMPKNWCFWTVVLEKTLESPLDYKEIQPIHPKGNHFWIFIGRPDVKAETPILWLPHVKSWLIGKDPDAGKDWGQKEKGTTEDEITNSMDMGLGGLRVLVMDREAWRAVIHGVAKGRSRLSDWTELILASNHICLWNITIQILTVYPKSHAKWNMTSERKKIISFIMCLL